MTEHFRIFVNERPVGVAPGTTAREAARAFDPALGARLDAGEAYLTDGRGVRLEGDELVAPGSILRVVVSARRKEGGDAQP